MRILNKYFFSLLLLLIASAQATHVQADGGWYVGGSIGQSSVDFDFPDSGETPFGFDDNDTAWKVYGGYVLDLPLVDFGVEGGYVNLGEFSERLPMLAAEADITGLNLWGVAGIDVGPIGVFGKLGAVAWDLDGRVSGIANLSIDDNGTDIGYGLGAKFMLFSLEFRAEYERYQIEDGVDMFSVGATWVF